MKKNIIVFGTVFALAVLAGCAQPTENPSLQDVSVDNANQGETQCNASGGKWESVGKLQNKSCIYYYSDAGKSCTSSDDCLGDCITTEVDGSNPHCAEDSNKFGCKASVENYKLHNSIICID